jgi:hypothetical protein
MTPLTTEGGARIAGGGEKRPPRWGGAGAARARGPARGRGWRADFRASGAVGAGLVCKQKCRSRA